MQGDKLKTPDGSHTDRFKYGYDRNSSRLYRDNVLNDSFDELYHANGASAGYDQLNQLTDFRRGALSDTNSDNIPDTVTSPTRQQGWEFDALGNFDSQTTDGTPQTRTHNKQNQSTVVGGNNLTFDANGNTTKDETGKTYTFDAFNRLVLAKDSGGATIATYSFDALGRRIVETVSGTVRDIYFSPGWQIVEEQISATARTQYVWSPVYIDALIARDRDADANGNGSLEERLYAQQDANFNMTGVINTAGSVLERFIYDPYGTPTFLTASWTTLAASAYAWTTLHQGGRFEPVTGLYHFRNREYSATLGRWATADPLRFNAADADLYRYVHNQPVYSLDPFGLQLVTPGALFVPLWKNVGGDEYGKWQFKQQIVNKITFIGIKGLFSGSQAELAFTPGPKSSCSKITFVQVIKRQDHTTGKPRPQDPPTCLRMTKDGFYVDASPGSDYGYYSYNNDGTPDTGFGSDGASDGAFPSPALMNDTPLSTIASVSQLFYTCAVCTEGADSGMVYSCISWGHDISKSLVSQPRPPEFLPNAPQQWFDAVNAWNMQAKGWFAVSGDAGKNSIGQRPLPEFKSPVR